jgi:hypothetical protein
MLFCKGPNSKYASDSEQVLEKVQRRPLAVIKQALGEESVSRTWVFEWKSPNSPRLKKAKRVKSEVKSILIIFIGIKSLFTRNLFWQAKQSISHTTVMFYGNCMKLCDDFAPNFGDKRTGSCIMTAAYLSLPISP